MKTMVDLNVQELQPEVILDKRLVKKGNKAIPQMMVKWSNLPTTSTTWEDWNVLTARFPSVVSCGQATSSVGGGVAPGIEGASQA